MRRPVGLLADLSIDVLLNRRCDFRQEIPKRDVAHNETLVRHSDRCPLLTFRHMDAANIDLKGLPESF
jgi:hypothetical protein